MNKFTFLAFAFISTFHLTLAQTDSLIFKNGNYIVGEIKSMERAVITVETDYSDSDFKIEWSGLDKIYSNAYFLITLSDGTRYNGYFESIDSDTIKLITDAHDEVIINKSDLVYLKEVDQGFWSRLYASVDFGFSFSKSNNLKQLSLRSNIGYLAERWSSDLSFSSVNSTQDEVDPIKRTDISWTYRYFLPKDWYGLANISFLSNTEQKLDLRTNGKMGLGKYIIHTNKSYWGFQAGLSVNNEKFSSETESRQSLEGYMGTELNMFDVGDLSLLTQANAYPGITEKGRWRADFRFDTKYDLPLDFYVKLGFTLNYDNQPVEGASATDFVFQTTVGWEL